MKKSFLIMLLTVWGALPILAQGANEQKDSVKQEKIFCGLNETQAYFRGGQQALRQYLEENVDLSVIDGTTDIQGRVVVSFMVEKDGSVTDVKVIKGLDITCDAEAVRVVKNMPKWMPATLNGKRVKQKFILPVGFHVKQEASPQPMTT